MSFALRKKWFRLQDILRSHARVLIAYSGGCDSAFLAAAARQTLGRDNVLAITAVSASLPAHEKEEAQHVALETDVAHQFLETQELDNPAYADNPSNRCFFCKNELFSRLSPLADARGMKLADGFNLSDRADYRPGFKAAQDWNVIHPLDEAQLSKPEIRVLSRWLGLSTWNKPAAPCLASRIPYGTPVTKNSLSQIEQAEAILRAEGFRVARVRHHGKLARVEVPLSELERLIASERWQRIAAQIQLLGFEKVEADPRGFQSGRLNENLTEVAL